MNVVVGVGFVAATWWRGRRPGWGTLIQPVVVGAHGHPRPRPRRRAVVAVASDRSTWWSRCPSWLVGVAGYLASQTGAGPAEGLALTTAPRIPFRWSYSVIQSAATIAGWLLGSTFGVGTFLVPSASGRWST